VKLKVRHSKIVDNVEIFISTEARLAL